MLGVAAVLCFAAPARAADHRDAPTIDDYSAIDINDLFMFRDPHDSTKLVMVLSTQAVADPLFQPSYHFQQNALYRFNFTTNQNAIPTAHIDVVFGSFANQAACPAPEPACQPFQVRFPHGVVVEGLATQGTAGATHLPPVIVTEAAGTLRAFAGPREDPFFFDLVGFNRSVAAGANKFTGVDAFLGKNVNAIALEFPVGMVFPAGSCAGTTSPVFATPCGAWAVTYLAPLIEISDADLDKPDKHLQQVDRMGNPAVNTALIPAALKDSFNFGNPHDDAKDFAAVILKQILGLDQKFGTCPPTATSAAACNPNVPLLASVAVPDILRFASSLPDGFPNGRRPADRTTDVLISLILQIPGFTDGTAAKIYCSSFPFLGPPLQLSGSAPFEVSPQSCP
jgi:hypothetical protein